MLGGLDELDGFVFVHIANHKGVNVYVRKKFLSMGLQFFDGDCLRYVSRLRL